MHPSLTQNCLIGPVLVCMLDKLINFSRKKVKNTLKKAEPLPPVKVSVNSSIDLTLASICKALVDSYNRCSSGPLFVYIIYRLISCIREGNGSTMKKAELLPSVKSLS